MSEYVLPEDQQVPVDHEFDLDLDLFRYIDPALLSLHALEPEQGIIAPAGQDLHPFETGQSG
jgi:hypothetical protein